MRNFFSITLTFIMLLSISCKAQKVNYFSNNAYGEPIVGKSGEYYKGVTYVAYQGEKEDPYVVAYDHKNKKWIGPYKAGTSLLGKTPGKKIDNHGKPTLVVDGEGYIHLVFGGHGGTPNLGENTLGNYNGGKQIHVKSKKPLDISQWEEVENISPFGTYSQFLKMDNGDMYLFYRHGAHRSNWVYQVSKDNCRTFSPVVSFLKAKPTSPNEKSSDVWDSWYIYLEKGNKNDIVVSYNYHLCYGVGNIHYGERHNCYYMRLDTEKNEWFNVAGEKIQIPVTKEYADSMTLVVNTGENWNHIGRVSLNNQAQPHVYWYEGEDDGSVHGGPKQLVNYYWTGNKWVGGKTNLPVEARGEIRAITPDSVNYLLGTVSGDSGEAGWWESTDGGEKFSKKKVLVRNAGGRFLVNDFIRNAHPDAIIMASQKIKGTDYSQLFLLGENGPIMRSKADADVLDLKNNF